MAGDIWNKESKKVLDTINSFCDQIRQAWEETKQIGVPSFKDCQQIVCAGMGGSGLGAHFIQAVFSGELSCPLFLLNSDQIPGFVGSKTLFIAISYSGNTAEVLAATKQAQQRGAGIFGITTGGKLGAFLRKNHFPAYIFTPLFNPSRQPRYGAGYTIGALLNILSKMDVLSFSSQEIESTAGYLQRRKQVAMKSAKGFAEQLNNSIPIIAAAEFLAANAHILANQINESAKNFAAYFLLPELNHHLLEGLAYPPLSRRLLKFVFLDSKQYSGACSKRIAITQEILKKNKIRFLTYQPQTKNKFQQAIETFVFGSYLSLFLARRNQANPLQLPWVDFFKKRFIK